MTAPRSGVWSLGVWVSVGAVIGAARVAGMVAGVDGSSAENGTMRGGGEVVASGGVIWWASGLIG